MGAEMSRWRELATTLRENGGGDERDIRDDSPLSSPIVPNVPIVLGVSSRPTDGPSVWAAQLNALDLRQPPTRFAAERWSVLVEDARWLAFTHGQAAAALGWCASDLFGVDPTLDGWGGLADRLHGARALTFTENVAHWRGEDCVGWLWRCSLTEKPLIWWAGQ